MTDRFKRVFAPVSEDVEEVKYDDPEGLVTSHNKLVNAFNSVSKGISFEKNFGGFIATVTFKASETVLIQHFLGVIPKWRVILRQEGNGVLSDIPSGWNNKVISIKNNGAVVVTASILIVRD